MCLSVWVLDGHPLYALLLASNRDELLARPTDPAHYWRDDPRVLAGRDLLCGGTWLGASTGGRLAFLSNCWAVGNRADAISRGALITDFLQGAEGAEGPREYLESVARRAHRFNGFNLVAADVARERGSSRSEDAAGAEEKGGGESERDAEGAGESESSSARVRMYYLTNAAPHNRSSSSGADGGGESGQGEASGVVRVEPGLHGLSNAALDTPWSKVERAKAHLAEVVAESGGGEVSADVIMERVLMDAWQPVHPHTSADVDEAEHCPMGPEYDQRLTPVFVNCDTPKGAYGTRSCIVVAVHRTGLVEFTEKSRSADAPTEWTWKRFRFHINDGGDLPSSAGNDTDACGDGVLSMIETFQGKAG